LCFLGDMFAVYGGIIYVNYNQYISIYFLYYDAKWGPRYYSG